MIKIMTLAFLILCILFGVSLLPLILGVFGILYCLSPVDLLPGLPVDDIIVAVICILGIIKVKSESESFKKISFLVRAGAVFCVILYVTEEMNGGIDEIIQTLFNFV